MALPVWLMSMLGSAASGKETPKNVNEMDTQQSADAAGVYGSAGAQGYSMPESAQYEQKTQQAPSKTQSIIKGLGGSGKSSSLTSDIFSMDTLMPVKSKIIRAAGALKSAKDQKKRQAKFDKLASEARAREAQDRTMGLADRRSSKEDEAIQKMLILRQLIQNAGG